MDHCICQTLVSYGPWCVFYATMCHIYWGLTHNVIFYWYPDLTSHTHTHMHTHTERDTDRQTDRQTDIQTDRQTDRQHTQGPVD